MNASRRKLSRYLRIGAGLVCFAITGCLAPTDGVFLKNQLSQTLDATMTPRLPAFPGAEGYGAETPGGRGGRVLEVTNLDDEGPGSFREALMTEGPRTIVFRVGGTITWKTRVTLAARQSYLTVAGQTAPGDGVQVKGFDLFLYGVHDVVLRYLKLRPGETAPDESSKNGLGLYGDSPTNRTHHVVIDHCSIYWGPDEGTMAWDYVDNVTWQWNMIEGLEHDFGPAYKYERSKALLIGTDFEGSAIRNFSVHHNYMANCSERNPLLSGDGPFELVNNLIYNWEQFGTGIQHRGKGTGVKLNLIGNYYRRGPLSNTARYAVAFDGDDHNPNGLVYVKDNLGPYRNDPSSDDWAIIGSGYDTANYWTAPAEPALRRPIPWPNAPIAITTMPALEVSEVILRNAGANLPVRDALDERLEADYRNGTGTRKIGIDNLNGIGTWWPSLSGGTAPPDSDHDGIPDRWEVSHGLNPNDPRDGATATDIGYTNLERYLNALTGTRP